jgi:propanediol utilization protein
MHLDTDDANAHFIKNGDIVKIVKIWIFSYVFLD